MVAYNALKILVYGEIMIDVVNFSYDNKVAVNKQLILYISDMDQCLVMAPSVEKIMKINATSHISFL